MKLKDEITELGEVPSDTQKDVAYKISYAPDTGTYFCECVGFLMSKKRPKTCHHIKLFLLKSALEFKLTDLQARGFLTFQSEGSAKIIIDAIIKIAREKLEV
jgi:hypothetical protein